MECVSRRWVMILLVAFVSAQSIAQVDEDKKSFYSLEFLRGVFKSEESVRFNGRNLEVLNQQLYNLKASRGAFMYALDEYVHAVERGESSLDREFLLNDVGTAASELVGRLAELEKTMESAGAKLAIDHADLEGELRLYLESRGMLVKTDILKRHKLNTTDLTTLRSIARRAQENSDYLNSALNRLRKAILVQQQKPK